MPFAIAAPAGFVERRPRLTSRPPRLVHGVTLTALPYLLAPFGFLPKALSPSSFSGFLRLRATPNQHRCIVVQVLRTFTRLFQSDSQRVDIEGQA